MAKKIDLEALRQQINEFQIDKDLKHDLLVFKKVKKATLLDEFGKPSKWNVYTKRYQKDAEEKGKVPPNYIDDCINSLGTARLGELGIDLSLIHISEPTRRS